LFSIIVTAIIIIIIIIIVVVVVVVTYTHGIYNYIPETEHFSAVYHAAAIL
jgi:hypothetical protein